MSDNRIKDALIESGYSAVKMTRNAALYFELKARVNGRQVNLMLDSGFNSALTLDIKTSRELGLTGTKFPDGFGWGASAVPLEACSIDSLAFDNFEITSVPTWIADFGHVNKGLEASKVSRIDGIIGSQLLFVYSVIVDYKNSVVYFGKPLTSDPDASQGRSDSIGHA